MVSWTQERKWLTSCCVSSSRTVKVVQGTLATSGLMGQTPYGPETLRTTLSHSRTLMPCSSSAGNMQRRKALPYIHLLLTLHTLSDENREALKRKFDIAYFVATEKLPLAKYPKLCELKKRLVVHLGHLCLNENFCKDFISYIALSKQEKLLNKICKANFFSVLLDGCTVKANIDNEAALVFGVTILLPTLSIHQ
uniref:Uncharacterized protein n=1 Tax=Amphimedon queenslandica TaxID=400682 RepID=A0A1X7TCM6_AMPQE